VVPYPSLAYWRTWAAQPTAPRIDAYELEGVGHRPILANRDFHALLLALVCAHAPSSRAAGPDTLQWYAASTPALVRTHTPLPAATPAAQPSPTVNGHRHRNGKRASMDQDWRHADSLGDAPPPGVPAERPLDGFAAEPTLATSAPPGPVSPLVAATVRLSLSADAPLTVAEAEADDDLAAAAPAQDQDDGASLASSSSSDGAASV
jgi:hypothetical protein